MMNITSMKNILKTLPLVSMLAVSLVLSPNVSMAGERDHDRQKYSHDSGKHHSKATFASSKHGNKGHGKHRGGKYNNHGHKTKHHDAKWHHGHKDRHVHRKHVINHYPAHRHHDHSRVNYVVHDHYYDNGHYGLGNLGFLLGLHSDNLDIILHD